ncbi:MAG TPA: DUF2334 domain-containing protein [Chloroflexi bacterium]|nr:DUF2334 domain-containing protein [Chloroflexota bacterium]
MANPIRFAAKAKGPTAALSRIGAIGRRYGWTPARMHRALARFADVLRRFDGRATFPITAVAVARHPDGIARYQNQEQDQEQRIEFAVHGYTHVDYSLFTEDEQIAHLRRARQILAQVGIEPTGFRSPYLQWNSDLYTALEATGFSYVSNQPIAWDVVSVPSFSHSRAIQDAYRLAMAFYDPWFADERLSLPRLVGGLVEIPVSLPDDEILIDRLHGGPDLLREVWGYILSHTYRRGELFTLQLHPERIALCADGLVSILSQAHSLSPPVWMARLDEIATWWRARAETVVTVEPLDVDDEGYKGAADDDRTWRIIVKGAPPGLTLSISREGTGSRSLDRAAGVVEKVKGGEATLEIHSPRRPCVGLSPDIASRMVPLLQEIGYVAEISPESDGYACYLHPDTIHDDSERALLAQIEETGWPLVRLDRWPAGSGSAIAVTGDIDALTWWDYVARLIGR